MLFGLSPEQGLHQVPVSQFEAAQVQQDGSLILAEIEYLCDKVNA